MSKHTPGPWVWIEPLRVLNSAHGKVIDHAYFEGMWFARHDDAEDEANARLIAAAPDLLSALQDLLAVYSAPDRAMCCDGRDCGCMGATLYQEAEHYARAAIAKATGEQK